MAFRGLLVRSIMNCNQFLDSFLLIDFLPTIKNKVSEVLNKVPEIKEILSENVQMIPAKDDIKTKIAEILDQLPAGLAYSPDKIQKILSGG